MYRIFSCLVLLCLTVPTAAEDLENNNPEVFTKAQIQADFEYLYAGLRSANFDLYALTSREDFDRAYREFGRSLSEPMTRFDTEMAFQKFAALAQQAHTRVESDYSEFFSYLSQGGSAFPLDVVLEGDQLIVTGNATGLDDILPGDRVVAIDGNRVSQLLPRLLAHISAESPAFAAILLERYMPLVVWLELGKVEASTLSIAHVGGAEIVYDLTAISGEKQKGSSANTPFTLECRDARMVTPTVAYLRPGPFSSIESDGDTGDSASYLDFVDTAFRMFSERQAAHLVLDLRDNPGGNNAYSDPVIAWFADRPFRFSSDFSVRVSRLTVAANQARLDAGTEDSNAISRLYAERFAAAEEGQVVEFQIPVVNPRADTRFNGDVFVLVNRYSFSNAVSAAAVIQDYGFGVIMGEQTVDMATTYGAMERFTLPNTGISVTYPKALIVRPAGRAAAHPVSPDIPLRSPRIRDKSDEMLAAAIDYIRTIESPN